MRRTALAIAGVGLAAPAIAVAQSDPVPLAPESWVTAAPWVCDWHSCDEGSVRFTLGVTPEGRVETCQIVESSGHARLDEKTCGILTRYARFAPARDKRGKAVAGRYTSWMHWKVPDAPPSPEAKARADGL